MKNVYMLEIYTFKKTKLYTQCFKKKNERQQVQRCWVERVVDMVRISWLHKTVYKVLKDSMYVKPPKLHFPRSG